MHISISNIDTEQAINNANLRVDFYISEVEDRPYPIKVEIFDPFFNIPYSPPSVNIECVKNCSYWVGFPMHQHFGKYNRLGFKGGIFIRFTNLDDNSVVLEKKFNFYKNDINLRKISNQYPLEYKRIWIIGDSNVWGTFGDNDVEPPLMGGYLPIRYSHPSLSLNRFLSGDNKSFVEMLPIEDGDILMFYLGEIDLRITIYDASEKKNIPIESLLEDTLQKYKLFIDDIVKKYPKNKVIVMSPNPPIPDGHITNRDIILVGGTEELRIKSIKIFDDFWKKTDIKYFDWKKPYTGSNGLSIPEFLMKNDHHIGNYDIIFKSLDKFILEINNEDMINDNFLWIDGLRSAQSKYIVDVFPIIVKDFDQIIEIGTFTGVFTNWLSKNKSDSCYITTYDINEEYRIVSDLKDTEFRISNCFDAVTISEIEKLIKSPKRTLILCDGGDKELEFSLFSRYLKKDDVIMLHDYSHSPEDYYLIKNKIGWPTNSESSYDNIKKYILKYSYLNLGLSPYLYDEFKSVLWGSFIKD